MRRATGVRSPMRKMRSSSGVRATMQGGWLHPCPFLNTEFLKCVPLPHLSHLPPTHPQTLENYTGM